MGLTNYAYKFTFFLLLLCLAGFAVCFFYIQSSGTGISKKNQLLLLSNLISKSAISDKPKGNHTINSPARNDEKSLSVTKGNWTFDHSSIKTLCPEMPPNLVGPLAVTFEAPSYEEIAKLNPLLEIGGLFKPKCQPRSKVAIIVPYRDRDQQLRSFLYHMHPVLQRQLLEYGIFVVEQSGDNKFNRALLMNIGYKESLQFGSWDCFIFHVRQKDVDLFVEDDRAPYGCQEGPVHMSGYIDKFEYKLPYAGIFGGISNIPRRHFEIVNGYSNLYFGWGGEDDDMFKRLAHNKFEISRYNRNTMKYKMWKHDHEKNNAANDRRFWLLKKAIDRMNIDGLNSLVYEKLNLQKLLTHILITVKVNEKDLTKAVFGAG